MPEQQSAPSQPGSEGGELTRIGIDIMYRLNRAFRMSKIYEPNNLIYLHQVDLFHHLLERALKDTEALSFALRQSTLLLNNIKMKFGFANYYLLKFAATEFEARDIGELLFARGVTKEELSGFIRLLAEKLPAEGDPHEAFLDSLKGQAVSRITINRIPAIEKSKGKERAAKKVYFLGITHLKEMFEKQEQKHVSLITTKRLMQSIFNHITDNESFLFGLTNIKNFDEYTLNHSVNVCILSIALGKKLGLDRKELVDLGLSAFFHDVGKLDVPLPILLKPGRLNEEERRIIEHHPHYGAEKLIQMREFSFLPLQALNVALEHHIREDEKGYPRYARKTDIHLFSKIVKIIDFFDAVTTKRPYRDNDMTRERALNLMMEKSGSEFDPLILKVFISMIGALPVGTLVLLNTAEIGLVYETSQESRFLLRPRVKLITDRQGHKIDGEVVDLTEIDRETNTYTRSIVKSLNPEKYGVRVPDYFVAEAQ